MVIRQKQELYEERVNFQSRTTICLMQPLQNKYRFSTSKEKQAWASCHQLHAAVWFKMQTRWSSVEVSSKLWSTIKLKQQMRLRIWTRRCSRLICSPQLAGRRKWAKHFPTLSLKTRSFITSQKSLRTVGLEQLLTETKFTKSRIPNSLSLFRHLWMA